MHRHSSSVGHHDLFDVLQLLYHTLRADIIGTVFLLDVAATGVLVVVAQCLKHIADGDLQCRQRIGVKGYLVLLQIAAKTVYLHDARYAGQLSFHNPVLYGAQFHGVVVGLVGTIYSQHILIDFSQSGGHGHHLWCTQFFGYLSLERLYLFAGQLPCLQGGHFFIEHHGHERQSES